MIYYREMLPEQKRKNERETALELLSYGLQEEYGIHTLPVILRSEKGKPFFKDYPHIHFNYSHCKKWAACGVSAYEIGIDIEDIRPVRDSLIRKVCSTAEQEWIYAGDDQNERMIMLWTMKEAYVKFLGTGISNSMNRIDFTSLLENGGNGEYQGRIMTVRRLENSYLTVYCGESNNILHV